MSGRQLTIGGLAATIIIPLWIGYGLYATFFKRTNFIGPLGYDKVGRQIFIQSFDETLRKMGGKDRTYVSSEWVDTNFLQRLFVQEPLRTSFVLHPDPEQPAPTLNDVDLLLVTPMPDIINVKGEDLEIQEDLKISRVKLYTKFYGEKFGTDFEDLLAGMGFNKFEVRYGSKVLFAKDLTPENGAKGVGHIGGD